MRRLHYYRSRSTNGATFTNAKSTLFDGVDERVTVPNVAALDHSGNNPFSFSIWVKPTEARTQRLISNYAYAVGDAGFILSLTATNLIKVEMYSPAAGAMVITSTAAVTLNAWNHVVWTSTGKTGAGNNLYLNNADAGKTAGTDTLTGNINTGAQLVFGFLPVHGLQFFIGNMDEACAYSSAISAGDRTTLYGAGAGGAPPTTGLISYWRFGDGDTFPTISDNQGTNHATMVNMEASDFVLDVPT